MSTRVKSFLLLGITLIVGIAIGILVTSAWQHHRNVALANTRIQGGMMRHLERIIEFSDEEQLTEVKMVLRRAEKSFMQQRRRMVDSLAFQHQILLEDLEQILTPDQWQRLEAWMDQRQNRQKRRTDRYDKRSERRSHRKKPSNQ
ncbi:MAG: hypothetical protein OXE92_03895 [Bacteroidetes bacterium]|nr:hypothetical protein [Bacteroidota bacterium]MCY4204851.1 hypothetical protein [Bacteroidota bacterium]